MRLVDANVILRYLLNDHAELSPKAIEIIEKQNVIVLTEVLAEVVYVLDKVYMLERKKIADVLSSFLDYPNISASDKNVQMRALELYGSTKMDFVDLVLIGHNRVHGDDVITFDKEVLEHIAKQ